MITVTSLPRFVTRLFRGMPGLWKSRHRLILCWLVYMQALEPGRNTLEELARWTPAQITVWRFRRLLKARYWQVPLLVAWGVQEAFNTLPPPSNGDLYLVGDGSDQPKRGTKKPLAQKGRKNEPHPWFFGIRFARLSANGDPQRLPVAFRLIRPQSHPAYQPDKALFRAMGGGFVPPAWAKRVIVAGDAADGSQDNRQMVMPRDADDLARPWGCGFALARTWKTVEGKALTALGTHLPRQYDQRTRVPRLPGATGCKPFWVQSTRLGLRHLGDVTGVWRKKGRHLGPKQTKILGTHLDEWLPRQVVGAQQRRWPVAQIKRELKTDLGLGEPQVRKDERRLEQSFGRAVLAYLGLRRAGHQEIVPGKSWRIAQLQPTFRLRVMTNQGEHNLKARLTKARNVA